MTLSDQPLAPDAPAPPTQPISADRAITLARRWILGAWLFTAVMITVVAAATFVGFSRGMGAGPGLFAGLVWLGVIIASIRSRRLAFEAMPLIVAGEFGLAEDQLGQSLRSFSLLSSSKLIGLHQLAMLRHAQSRWADAAKLCRELLTRGGRHTAIGNTEFDVQNRLMLAESLIELGDTAGAGAEMLGLSGLRLDLRQTLLLTQIRLDLQAGLEHWHPMMATPRTTIGLIELMPAAMAARCYALLALAAKRIGAGQWLSLLLRRSILLSLSDPLVERRPFLRELFD